MTEGLEECLRFVRSGERGAVDRLCAVLRPKIDDYVRRRQSARVRRWVPADDVVQEILLGVVKELAGSALCGDPEQFLRNVQRLVRCRVLDAGRNHRRFIGESAFAESIAAAPGASRSAGPVTAEDRHRWLEELVAKLPEKYAPIVRLCGLEGLTYVEAARRLKLKPDTVRKRYEAAREALKRRIRSLESA